MATSSQPSLDTDSTTNPVLELANNAPNSQLEDKVLHYDTERSQTPSTSQGSDSAAFHSTKSTPVTSPLTESNSKQIPPNTATIDGISSATSLEPQVKLPISNTAEDLIDPLAPPAPTLQNGSGHDHLTSNNLNSNLSTRNNSEGDSLVVNEQGTDQSSPPSEEHLPNSEDVNGSKAEELSGSQNISFGQLLKNVRYSQRHHKMKQKENGHVHGHKSTRPIVESIDPQDPSYPERPESPLVLDSNPASATSENKPLGSDSLGDDDNAPVKNKGKRPFFNSSIFRTPLIRYNSLSDENTNEAPFTGHGILNSSERLDMEGGTAGGELPVLHFATDDENAITENPPTHHRNELRKTRSKSDFGVYGPLDIRDHLPNSATRSQSNDSPRFTDDSALPDHLGEANISDAENEGENAATRGSQKKRRNFFPRNMSITQTFPNFATGFGGGHHHATENNNPQEEGAEGAETNEQAAAAGQNQSRRHTIFSMDYNANSTSAAIKNAFRRFKKKKPEKQEEEVPDEPSGLVSELAAGIPAAMIIPMSFLKDERNIQRIPVLLQHLEASFTDISRTLNEKNRKYQIELKYGSGSASLSWKIIRDYRDLMTLHSRLKVLSFQSISNPKLQLPKFPSRHSIAENMAKERVQQHFNDHRHSRAGSIITQHSASNTGSASVHAPVAITPINSASSGGQYRPYPPPVSNAIWHPHTQLSTILDDPQEHERQSYHSERSGSILSMGSEGSVRSFAFFRRVRRAGSVDGVSTHNHVPGHIHVGDAEKERFVENLRQGLEKYLLDLFNALRFRPEANRVFQFLELSNMSMRLAPENSYHGKEGYLILRSSAASMGWRVSHWKPNELSMMIDRHTSRWYLVRESYIVCVNDISSVNVTEVFMVDPSFRITHGLTSFVSSGDNDENNTSDAAAENSTTKHSDHQGFTFEVGNGERKMKLLTTSQRQLGLWIESINHMVENTVWSKPHRFQSFAPVRQNVQARWFVDARDYFWTVSVALDMAKDVIYIHDWWLSPELYLRRPADGNQEWRLDRLLRRKAEQGVKIFVIVYRNVGQTVPIDSSWTKHSLLDLHPNIYLMRSPNQLLQNTYFWAHHEKLCLIDHTIGFLGGIDLCFGRWDTPEHVLVDDAPNAFMVPNSGMKQGPTQIWPGKDYSNPRQRDFYNLDKPYDDMYDRKQIPRMPWHDVHMMVTGQPARDLVRHFVQRWNYLIRQKRPSRFTPLLLPPTDLTDAQLKSLNLEGSCEVQLLRSSCTWSLGIKKPEHSIQNAYLKAIENSKHFIYIENQFFISSTFYEGTKIENKIGDALVRRIIRAHRNKEQWKCVVVIPLMPGFESEIDEKNGLSVRMIMQFQYLTISHGPNSIFGRLFQHNINPEDYIQFFSLRKWGKIGPDKKLVSEQLYLHCKTMIVDDVVAIIGSANINERSMRGTRDSEVASIVRDTEQIDSKIGGKDVKVGKFPHTLRVRLMREHVGIDIDQLDMIERLVDRELSKLVDAAKEQQIAQELGVDIEAIKVAEVEVGGIGLNDLSSFGNMNGSSAANGSVANGSSNRGNISHAHAPTVVGRSDHENQRVELHSFNHLAGEENIGFRDKKPISSDSRVQGSQPHKNDVDGLGFDQFRRREAMDHVNSEVLTSVPPTDAQSFEQSAQLYFEQLLNDVGLETAIKDPRDIKRRIYYYIQTRNWRKDTPSLDDVSKEANNGNHIPVSFFPDKCDSDDNIFQFRDINEPNGGIPLSSSGYGGRSSGDGNASGTVPCESDLPQQRFAPIDPYAFCDPLSAEFYYDMWERVADQNTLLFREVFHCQPDDEVTTWKQYIEFKELFSRFAQNQGQPVPHDQFEINVPEVERQQYSSMSGGGEDLLRPSDDIPSDSQEPHVNEEEEVDLQAAAAAEAERQAKAEKFRIEREQYEAMLRRRRQNRRSSRNVLTAEDVYQPEIAERVLQGIRGNLVFFPTQWLAHELDSGNWHHAIDRLPPIEIYD